MSDGVDASPTTTSITTSTNPVSSQSLTEQRDQWLRSLDQLDSELAAGDLSVEDHRVLTDRYSVQLADVLHRLKGDEATAGTAPSSATKSGLGGDRSAFGRLITVAALSLFAVGAGLLLARAVGERGVGEQLSGAIDSSARSRVADCQQLGAGGGDLVGALSCFDDVLLTDPDNAEALSYRGWYLLLTAGSLQSSADSEAQSAEAKELIDSGLSYLDRAIEADPLLPDPLAFRATVHDRQGEREQACADIAALLALDPPQFFVEQTAGIAQRNGC